MADEDDGPNPSVPQPAGRAGAGSDLWRIALRRRRFLVDRRYQLRTSFVAVGVALALLLLLNVSLFVGADAPAGAAASSSDQTQFGLILAGSLVFLVGVFLVSVLETHRTAGAALKIGRAMERVRSGHLKTRLRLRRGDNLQDLASSFNAMSGALHEKTWEDVEALDAAADRIENEGHDPESRLGVSRALRRLAEQRRKSLD
jgi:methyl-accepting chemotaxis protein